MSRTLFKNLVYFDQTGDLMINNTSVEAFFPGGADINADQTFFCNGCMAFPSLVDAHVHFRDPGQEYKEDVSSGLHAAAGGGFGHVLNMANTDPVADSASVVEYIQSRAKSTWPNGPVLHQVGALTKGLRGKELAPMSELADAGCVAFSNDGVPVSDTAVFRRAMEYARDLDRPVIDHCEDPAISPRACMNEGEISALLGLPGSPVVAESLQVARDILLAQYLEIPIHLAHISCRQSIELISWAKEKSIPVTAETCPHYLFLDETRVEQYDTSAKVNPPLRTADDVLAMRQAIRTGTIDIITSDHAPHAEFEKNEPFSTAPFGISGLDASFSLLFSLCPDVLNPSDLLSLCLENPASIYKLQVSTLAPGDSADFFLFDPEVEWVLGPNTMFSRGKNTPFCGQTLKGRVMHHFMNGKHVFSRN